MFLAFLLIAGMACCPSASAEVNHCSAFEEAINDLRWYSPYWNIAQGEAFPLSSIMNYTRQLLCCDAYGEEPIAEGEYTYFARYAIPADVFEAAAMDSFANVDVESLRSYTSFFWDHANFTGTDNFQNYQADRQVYLFSNSGGMGDPSRYQVLGYQEKDGYYTVYSRFLSPVWDSSKTVEDRDYVIIDGTYYAVEHYLETVVAISNGRVRFHSWNQRSELPEMELTKPLTVFVESEDITIAAPEDAFPADVSISVGAPAEEVLEMAHSALADVAANYIVYDIRASVQPNGTVQVTFAIPQGFDWEKLALFYISDQGELLRLDTAVNTNNGTITAELTHFSLYALAELAPQKPLPGDANGDGVVNTRDARIILRYIAGLVSEEELNLSVADMNGDGIVNTRDARAVLRHVAGLE